MTRARMFPLALSATGLLALGIFVLALAPARAVPAEIVGDKVQHAAAFATLAFLPCAVRLRAALWVGPLLLLYGGAIEVVQFFVGRDASWYDVGADLLGISLGVAAGAVAGRMWRGRAR